VVHPRVVVNAVASVELPHHTWLHRSPDGGWLLIHWDTGRLALLDAELTGPVHELTLPDWPPGRLGSWALAVAPDRSVAAVVSQRATAVYDAAGRPLWHRGHHVGPDAVGCVPACHLDGDGRLWAYLPDQLLVHDARTGDQIARADLDCGAGAGSFLPHPDHPDTIGVEVATGEDGTIGWRARVEGGAVMLDRIGGGCLTDTLPGGRYLAIPDDDLDDGVTVRRWTDGAVLARRPLDDLATRVADEALVETGTTIGARHVLVAVNDPEDPDESEHHVVLAADTLETVAWLDYGAPMRVYSIVGGNGPRWLTHEGPDRPAHLWELP
jgi:hypothetical protein